MLGILRPVKIFIGGTLFATSKRYPASSWVKIKKKKKKKLDRRGSIPRPAAKESSSLTTEPLTLAVATVKRMRDEVTWPEQGKSGEREYMI